MAETKDAVDAKKVVDMAHAAAIYARRQKLSQESIDYAQAVKIDAMTLMGGFLMTTPKANGAQHGGRTFGPFWGLVEQTLLA